MATMDTLSMMTGMPKGNMRRGRHVGKKSDTAGSATMKKGAEDHETHFANLSAAKAKGDLKGMKSSALSLAKAAHRAGKKAGGC